MCIHRQGTSRKGKPTRARVPKTKRLTTTTATFTQRKPHVPNAYAVSSPRMNARGLVPRSSTISSNPRMFSICLCHSIVNMITTVSIFLCQSSPKPHHTSNPTLTTYLANLANSCLRRLRRTIEKQCSRRHKAGVRRSDLGWNSSHHGGLGTVFTPRGSEMPLPHERSATPVAPHHVAGLQ